MQSFGSINVKVCRCGCTHASPACPRCGKVDGTDPSEHQAEEGPEAALQGKIIHHLKENGFYYFHDYSRGRNTPGHPDLVVAMPHKRTLWLELKSKTGRLSEEQKRVRLMIEAMGHEFYKVVSFKQFLEIVRKGDARE